MERFTEDAYYGLRPRLTYFRMDLLEPMDLSGPAGRVPMERAA